MARQQGRQYDEPWENIMDDRIYNKKGHQTGTRRNDSEPAEDNTGTFGRRSTNSNRTNRNSDYLQLMQYQVSGSQYSLSDPALVYDNLAYSDEQFPAGRYKKHRTYSESTSSGICRRPCVVGTIITIVVIALGAAGVGLYFGVFRNESTQATLTVFATELRLTGLTWDTRLGDPTSAQFATMKADVQSDLTKIMRQSSLRSEYQSVEVSRFRPGSIKVECLMRLLAGVLSAQDVKSSLIQSYNSIDKVALKVAKNLDTTAITISVAQPTTTSATTQPTTSPPVTHDASTTVPTTTTTTTTNAQTTLTTTKPISTTTTSITSTTATQTTKTTTTTPPTTTSTPPFTTTTTPTTTTTTTPTTTTTTSPTTTTTTSPTTTKTTIPTTSTPTTPTTTTPTNPTTTTPTTPTTTTPTTPTTTIITTPTTSTPTTPTTTTTTSPTTTTTTTPVVIQTTPGPMTPDVCRNTTLAAQLLFQCFDFQTFLALTTDDAKCSYLTGVGNCLEEKIETSYNVNCTYSDQLAIINSFAGIVTQALQFDLITICNFQRR